MALFLRNVFLAVTETGDTVSPLDESEDAGGVVASVVDADDENCAGAVVVVLLDESDVDVVTSGGVVSRCRDVVDDTVCSVDAEVMGDVVSVVVVVVTVVVVSVVVTGGAVVVRRFNGNASIVLMPRLVVVDVVCSCSPHMTSTTKM